MAPREATATPIMPRSLGDMPSASPALPLPLLPPPLLLLLPPLLRCRRAALLLLLLLLGLKKEGSSSSSRNKSTTAVWHCTGHGSERHSESPSNNSWGCLA